MGWSYWIRQLHRWLSILFTLTVVANFVALWAGYAPPVLVYAPLPPLFLMLITGLYMFFLPYARRSKGDRAEM